MALISGTTKVEIVSQALTLIGNPRPTNNLNDDPRVVAVSKLYDTMVQSMLTRYRWRFSLTFFELNKLAQAPANTYWRFAYQIPPEYLTLVRIYKSGQKGGYTDYQIYQDQIWTNVDAPLLADYIFDPGPEFYPAYFVDLLIYELAYRAAVPIAQNYQLKESLSVDAKSHFLIARSSDANSSPNTFIQRNDVANAHYGL